MTVPFRNIQSLIIAFSLGVFSVICAPPIIAQTLSNRPVRLITTEVGGTADFVARVIAQEFTAGSGNPVIVENQGGGGGIGAGRTVAAARPDGHTLLFYGSSIWLLPFLRANVPWDALRDFAPVTMTNKTPLVLVVHAAVPAGSVKELIALAKSRPNALNYASGSVGSIPHLAAELFKAMAGVELQQVNYRGAGPSVTALIRGEVQVIFTNLGSVESNIKAGKLKALAVTSANPTTLVLGVPTLAATGVPGYDVESGQFLLAPAGTPASIINQLNQEMLRVVGKPEVKEKLFTAGVEAVGSTPEQVTARIKSDQVKWGKLIKDAGITAD